MLRTTRTSSSITAMGPTVRSGIAESCTVHPISSKSTGNFSKIFLKVVGRPGV
jgi:hypothetical protein